MQGPSETTLYAYLDIGHPMVAWEVAIGRIKSPRTSSGAKFGLSIWQYNLLYNYSKHGLNQKFVNELRLELTRAASFKEKASRLQGLYFFETIEDAKLALMRWNIDLNEKYISEVRFIPDKLTKVDSEWITAYLDQNGDTSWMEKYWLGGTKSDVPLNEILATGFGEILNYDLRLQAYRNILEIWPYATPLLAMACCAFQVSRIDHIATVMPGIFSDGSTVRGNYVIDISDLKNEEKRIIDSIEICKKQGTFPATVRPKDPGAFFLLPDLRSLEFSFESQTARELFERMRLT